VKAKSIDRIVSAQAVTSAHCTVKPTVKNAACNIVYFMHNGEFVESGSSSIPSSDKK
jgi:ABC-type glutathione transport system ATPase component